MESGGAVQAAEKNTGGLQSFNSPDNQDEQNRALIMDELGFTDEEDFEEYDDDDSEQDYAANTKGRYLTFALNGQEYGMAIATVRRIIGVPEIIEVPSCPPFARGIINLMGTHVPVVDLRMRYGMPCREYDDRTCIIIHNIGDAGVGLVVDWVNAVVTIEDEQILPPPSVHDGKASGAGLVGIVRDTTPNILLLELAGIFSPDELEWFYNKA